MKYVDQILDYLAEGLNPEERDRFEKELLLNNELKKEFDIILLIEKKLKEIYHEDIRDNTDRLKKMHEILYDDDIRRYGGPPISPEEHALIRNIRKGIKYPEPDRKNPGLNYRLVLPVISVAALIILALILSFHKPAPNKLFAQYFKPQKDIMLINLMESTRGKVNPGIILYYQGHFAESMEYLQPLLLHEDSTGDLKLYYLLSCMNINCDEDLSDLLKLDSEDLETEIEHAFIFYSGLYMLHNDNIEGASERLNYLARERNRYYLRAKRLLRKIR